jgi:hypothetical protein
MSWTKELEEQFMKVFDNCVFSLPTASENAFNKEDNHERTDNKQPLRQNGIVYRKTEGS